MISFFLSRNLTSIDLVITMEGINHCHAAMPEAMATMANQLTEARETAAMYGMEMPAPHEAERRPSVTFPPPWRPPEMWSDFVWVRKFGDIFREKQSPIFLGWSSLFQINLDEFWCIFQPKKHIFQTPPFYVDFSVLAAVLLIEIPSFLVICTAPFLETFPGSSATGDHGSPGPWPRILRDWLAAKWWIHGIIFIFLLGTYQIILNINNMSVAFLWITSSYQWFFGVSIMLEAPNKFYIMGLITISIDGQEDSWGPWPAFWDPPGPLRDTDICPTEILCGRCRCGSLWPWWPLAMGSQLVASCLGWCREVTPNWLLGWFMALSLPGPIIDVFVDVNTL